MNNEVSGILILDKPAGMSSARLVAGVKKLLKLKKVGHAGTLDPFATGVMILLINQATRLSEFFLKGNKTYEGVLRLGISTDTQDATGTVVARRAVNCSREDLDEVFRRFKGTIFQQPPVYSALKHQGTPLYKLAREGRPIIKPPRKATIKCLEIIRVDLPEIAFNVSCSGGTYVRTLCADIGEKLGCGGHLKSLRRKMSCGFCLTEAISWTSLQEMTYTGEVQKRIIGMGEALRELPRMIAPSPVVEKLRKGRRFFFDELFEEHPSEMTIRINGGGHLQVLDTGGNLVAILKRTESNTEFQYRCVFQ
jgi:tRNA pseudouridine55 synthase